MVDAQRILLGGVSIEGLDGVVTFSSITGWYGVPDGRGGNDAIPGAHGSFKRADVWRESRAVTIVGALHTGSRSEAESERDHLTAAWATADLITVVDETGAWSTAVEVDRVGFQDRGAWSPQIPLTIDLVAPDPVRYRDWVTAGPAGLPVQEGGLVLPSAFPWDFGTSTRPVAVAVNDGSVPVLPRITVTGSADSIIVHGGPRRLEYGSFSGVLVFDAVQRRAFLNGIDVTRLLIRRDWPMVPAGVSQDFYFSAVNPSTDISLIVEYQIGVW